MQQTLQTSQTTSRFARLAPVRYVLASPLPHLTATGSALVCALLSAIALQWTEGKPTHALVLGMVASGWLGLAAIALADAFSRFREYRRFKCMLSRYGFRPRILSIAARSRCQRDAAMQAARETGHASHARAYFRSLGYRWYHLLPDAVMANPLLFFHPDFLKNSFLPGKKYQAGARRPQTSSR